MSSYPVLDPSLHHVMFGAIPSDQRFIISSSDFSSKLVKTPSYDTITFSSIFLAPTMVIVPAHDLSLSLPSDCPQKKASFVLHRVDWIVISRINGMSTGSLALLRVRVRVMPTDQRT